MATSRLILKEISGIAFFFFFKVYCQVVPKRQALSQANTELDNATAKLFTIQKKLDVSNVFHLCITFS